MGVRRNLLANLPGIAAVAALPLGILAGIFLGGGAAGIVFVVGWLLVVPLSAILIDEVLELDEEQPEEPSSDPLETLRERYALGEIDEGEFERRLDLLVKTEGVDIGVRDDLERVREATGRGDPSTERGRER